MNQYLIQQSHGFNEVTLYVADSFEVVANKHPLFNQAYAINGTILVNGRPQNVVANNYPDWMTYHADKARGNNNVAVL
jgi:hypothetical protein